jgi:myo-inositol-hexaphosphate 3-phosphohydrolase
MDSLGGGLGNLDLTKLSDRDKQELQQFALNEGQKARIQSCTFSSPLLSSASSSYSSLLLLSKRKN